MVFLNLWENRRNLLFFDLFDYKNKNKLVFYSCFNYKNINWRLGYNSNNINENEQKKFIFYTGERFLDDVNSDITIGFLPNNINIIYKFDNSDISYKYLSNSEINYNIIRNFDLDIDKFNNINYNDDKNKNLYILNIDANKQYLNNVVNTISVNAFYNNIRNECKNEGKIYLQIRDQERTQIEYLFREHYLPESKPEKINIYQQNYKFEKIFSKDNKFIKDSKDLFRFIENNLNIYRHLNSKWYNYSNKFNKLLNINNSDSLSNHKPKFCCFIVSNPEGWQRNEMFKLLSEYKKVDSLGRFMKNVDIIIPDRVLEQDEYFNLISQYKFMINFENYSYVYYNTEKIFNTFQAGTIPIYWGDPLIHKLYNKDCFINVEYSNNKEQQLEYLQNAVEQIIELDKNDKKYIEMFNKKLVINEHKEDNRLKQNLYYLMTL